jgi:hypothetical protein
MTTIQVPIHFETEQARAAFDAACTGNDDCVLLAAERAINARIGASGYEEGAWVDRPEEG